MKAKVLKVTLLAEDGCPVEIRRFPVDNTDVGIFKIRTFREKIIHRFPTLINSDRFDLFWKGKLIYHTRLWQLMQILVNTQVLKVNCIHVYIHYQLIV